MTAHDVNLYERPTKKQKGLISLYDASGNLLVQSGYESIMQRRAIVKKWLTDQYTLKQNMMLVIAPYSTELYIHD